MSAAPHGFVGLDVGQVRVPINFGRFVLGDFAFDYHYVENTIDAPPLIALRPTPGERILTDGKITGCWLELNGSPDTTHYVLRWGLV